ncbi:hypothetical protein QJS66_15125 [Kocuria rhizophila]|nr:hypothetical protein QJS66_15125 [Kocuria rhizophila]
MDLMNAGRGSPFRVLPRPTPACSAACSSGTRSRTRTAGEPSLDAHHPEPVAGPGYRACVFIGSLLGVESPWPRAFRSLAPSCGSNRAPPWRSTCGPTSTACCAWTLRSPWTAWRSPGTASGSRARTRRCAPERTGYRWRAGLDELRGTAYDDGRPFPQLEPPTGQPDPLPAPELPNTVLRARG